MYHCTESGLQNVWLANGFKIKKTEGGKAVATMDAEGLHHDRKHLDRIVFEDTKTGWREAA